MKVLLVDDEPRALERLEKMCRINSALEIVGAFTQPKEALAYAEDHEIELVLLDIEMPHLTGIAFAEQLFELKPSVEVIFITAYDQYAIEAFKVAAVGYLLKPITQEELDQQIERRLKKRNDLMKINEMTKKDNSWLADKTTVNIYCMGGFQCVAPNGAVIKWRTQKAEELVAILAHHQFKPVSKDYIIDQLWPQMSYERASKNLHAICYYIRDTFSALGFNDVLIRSKGTFMLNQQKFTLDVIALKTLLDKPLTELKRSTDFDNIVALDRGTYFEGKSYEWAQPMETWLLNRLENLYLKRSADLIGDGFHESANALLLQVIKKNVVSEEAYERLIKLSIEQGDHPTAVRWYQKYEAAIKNELDLEPSEAMKQLIKKDGL